jgi:hypothetical protein
MHRIVSVCLSILNTFIQFSSYLHTFHTGARMYLADVSTLTSTRFLDTGRGHMYNISLVFVYTELYIIYYTHTHIHTRVHNSQINKTTTKS